MATSTDDNEADGNSVKYKVEIIWRRGTSAKSLYEAIEMAQDVLCLTLYWREKEEREIPVSTEVNKVFYEDNEFVSLIACDTDRYRSKISSLRLSYEKEACGITLLCDVIPMGRDYTICVRDAKGGHVGSTVMSIARQSLTGEGISATSSVLNRVGHKDDEVARMLAEAVAIQKNCTVVCTCGIHLDGITPDQIQEILDACGELEQMILADMEGEKGEDSTFFRNRDC
ncbi:MAG: hypothetical protein LUH20_02205 [Lachnospiraceae bacterium]|nr:hypothetical protein [Lachnospiraceae bacterium]